MIHLDRLRKMVKALILSLITGFLVMSLISCSKDRGLRAATPADTRQTSTSQLAGNFSEVSPPEVIQQLRQTLESYQPQVKILSPQADEVFQDDTVTAEFQVQDLPVFKNPELDMGPHLHVILDNQPYIAAYNLKPLVLPDLAPGTHTLRVFASRPWHESFKNEGAYAQTTFHVFTKTEDNHPDAAQPILTYSRPKGSYTAEPILLDFYLTNAPLHLVAQENSQDEIVDWRIRCTINGNSFVLDRWEPIYLKGFKPGKNWVQLEFLDEQGNSVKNVFNNTVRVINYDPSGKKDTLAKLVKGEISADVAGSIVDPNYTDKASAPQPIPSPSPTLAPEPDEIEEAESEPSEEKPTQTETEAKDLTQTTTPETPEPQTTPQEPELPESKLPALEKPEGFFNRFRRPEEPSPIPKVMETPAPESVTPDVSIPQPEIPEPQPEIAPETQTIPDEPVPVQPKPYFKQPVNQRLSGYFNRFRRQVSPSPELPPTLPEIVEPSEPIPQPETLDDPVIVPELN